MPEKLKLAEMLCARFSHDIIGPVGALSNGAEFLREELGAKQSMAAELIESSSKEAVARVQFYRQAYGYSPGGGNASLTEMKDLSAKYLAGGKIKLVWDDKYTDSSNIAVTHAQKKLAMNLLIIAAASLIRGGTVAFEITSGEIKITATGTKAALPEGFKTCLGGKLSAEQLDARMVQCYYTSQLAAESGARIEIAESDEKVVLAFSL